VISIYFSKRGSLSTEMMKATEMAHTQAEVHVDPTHGETPTLHGTSASEMPPPQKKRITVEEDDSTPG
jgi:hypothetical protein